MKIKIVLIITIISTIAACSTQTNIQNPVDSSIVQANDQTSINSSDNELTSPESSDKFFLYIPDNFTMSGYMSMHSYLSAWDKNEIIVSDDDLSAIFINNFDKDTMFSLLLESFLRYTKNEHIQQRVLEYIDNNNIETGFTNSLKKLYAAVPVITTENEREIINYVYNDSEYDENINLFKFSEIELFNGELGLLLFDNDWEIVTVDNFEENLILNYGGVTNSILIIFKKHSGVNENEINTKLNIPFYNTRFDGNWRVNELPLAGILERAGADRFIIAHGYGPEIFPEIQTAIFNSYLYNTDKRVLYEVSYYMNFSPLNIHYLERDRIFNLLFFQSLFVFIR